MYSIFHILNISSFWKTYYIHSCIWRKWMLHTYDNDIVSFQKLFSFDWMNENWRWKRRVFFKFHIRIDLRKHIMDFFPSFFCSFLNKWKKERQCFEMDNGKWYTKLLQSSKFSKDYYDNICKTWWRMKISYKNNRRFQ